MYKMLLSLVMAVTILALPQIVVAEESAKDGPPGPEMLFKHLDVNHDGMIAEDEIPADLPEPLKALLKTADKNGDKKVSLEEFTAAVKEHPLPPPPFGMPPFGPGGPRMGVRRVVPPDLHTTDRMEKGQTPRNCLRNSTQTRTAS